MISLYTGTPGSGKSFHVAKDISDIIRFKRNCICISNIPIDLSRFPEKKRDKFIYLSNSDLTPDRIKEIAYSHFKKINKPVKEGYVKLYIDEAQMMFNARSWNDKDRKAWNEFFTIHRHLGIDVIMICQFDLMIDKQIRSLVEYQYIHRKVLSLGWRGLVLFVLSGFRSLAVTRIYYPLKHSLGLKLIYLNPRVFKIYDTFALFSSNDK